MKIAIIGGFSGLGFELSKAYVGDPRLHVTVIDDLSGWDNHYVQRIAYLKTIGQFDHLVELPDSLLDFNKVIDTSLPKRVYFNKFTMANMDPGWLFNHVEQIVNRGVHELLLIGDGSYAKSFERFDAYGLLTVKGAVVDNVFGCSFSPKCDLFDIMIRHANHELMVDEGVIIDFVYDMITSRDFVNAITSILFPEEFISLKSIIASESNRVVYNTYYITSNIKKSVSYILMLMHRAMVYVNPDANLNFDMSHLRNPTGDLLLNGIYKQRDIYDTPGQVQALRTQGLVKNIHKEVVRMAYMVDNYTKLNNSQV